MLPIRSLKRAAAWAAYCVAGVLAGVSPVLAQTSAPLREDPNVRTLLSKLVVPFVGPTERVEDVQARAELFVLGMQSGLALGIATVPLGTGSAGFAFVRDAATGERLLKSDSFGPVFLDRPITSGKGQFGIGFHYQRMSFEKLQGFDLREDGIPVANNTVIFLRDGFTQFENERLLIDSTASVFVATSTYGITDAFDIGVAVPIVSLDVTGQRITNYDFTYDWQDNVPGVRAVAATPTGQRKIDLRHASATGLGDVSIRLKYAFGNGSKQPVAAAVDLRLPTGDEENLLGAGEFGAKLQLLGSQQIGSFMNVYGSGGYTFNNYSDQVNYGAAVDLTLLPRKQLTVSFDVVGELLRDSISGLETVPAYPPGDGFLQGYEFRGLRRTSYDRYFFEQGSVSLLRAGVGAKYHLGGNVLLTGSVLVPLNDNGFSPGITPFIGIEKTWIR